MSIGVLQNLKIASVAKPAMLLSIWV